MSVSLRSRRLDEKKPATQVHWWPFSEPLPPVTVLAGHATQLMDASDDAKVSGSHGRHTVAAASG